MERKESRESVVQLLADALKKDRIKTFVYPISELGLVQLTRKRTRENIVSMLSESCPTCEGSGYVKSRFTVCYEVLRALRGACRKQEGKRLEVHLAPEVAQLLYEEEKASLDYLENTFGTKLNIIADPALAIESFRVEGFY
jgi:ribonuclease G